MTRPAKSTIEVQGTEVTVLHSQDGDFISLTDMHIAATTYANYRKKDIGTSIISVRFKMSGVDVVGVEGLLELLGKDLALHKVALGGRCKCLSVIPIF